VYTFSATGIENDHGTSFEDSTKINLGESVTGSITWDNEVDYFSFKAAGGQHYFIELNYGPNYEPFASWSRTFDGIHFYFPQFEGINVRYRLGRLSSSDDETWELVAPEDGEIVIEINGDTATYTYTLTVTGN